MAPLANRERITAVDIEYLMSPMCKTSDFKVAQRCIKERSGQIPQQITCTKCSKPVFDAHLLLEPCVHADDVVAVIWTGGLTGRSRELDDEKTQIQLSEKTFFTDFYSRTKNILGSGAFGRIRASCHLATGTPCATKRIWKELVGRTYLDINVEQDLFNLLLKISFTAPHSNVVRFLDFFEGPDFVFVAMEHLHGKCLFDEIIELAPIGEDFLQSVLQQSLSAVAYVHAAGVIHRDIKVENFRFKHAHPESPLVLLDFGLACHVTSCEESRPAAGTAGFMAPEMLSNIYSTPVDIWSIGIILYCLLVGRFPFPLESEHGWGVLEAAECPAALDNALGVAELRTSPRLATNLLQLLLVHTTHRRLTAAFALEHPWFMAGTRLNRSIGIEKESYVLLRKISSEMPVYYEEDIPMSGTSDLEDACKDISEADIAWNEVARPTNNVASWFGLGFAPITEVVPCCLR